MHPGHINLSTIVVDGECNIPRQYATVRTSWYSSKGLSGRQTTTKRAGRHKPLGPSIQPKYRSGSNNSKVYVPYTQS
jgi:hypothetical protein